MFASALPATRWTRGVWALAVALVAGPTGARAEDPEPQATGESHLGSSAPVDDLTVTPLKLKAKDLLGCMTWADKEGSAFFTLDDAGVVRRISYPTMTEAVRIDLGRKCSWLSLSAVGLVVTASGSGEVWLLDPDNLAVKRKIPLAGVRRAVSCPAQTMGVAATEDALYVIDLKRGGRPVRHAAPRNAHVGYHGLVMSPDGKYVLSTDYGRILRFAFTPAGYLKGDYSTPHIGSGAAGAGVMLSPDGKYVCLPTGAGNARGVKLHPDVKSYSTYVYPLKNLARPEFAIESGAYPRVVGYDPEGGWVFAQNASHSLLLFSYTGVKKNEYRLGGGGEAVRQFLAHPSGGKLLLLSERELLAIDLPANAK